MPVKATTYLKEIASSKLRDLDPILQNQSFIQPVFFQHISLETYTLLMKNICIKTWVVLYCKY